LIKMKISGELHDQGGVNISFLSAFPNENEHLFPPLTLLQFDKERTGDFVYQGKSYEVIEAKKVVWPPHDFPVDLPAQASQNESGRWSGMRERLSPFNMGPTSRSSKAYFGGSKEGM